MESRQLPYKLRLTVFLRVGYSGLRVGTKGNETCFFLERLQFIRARVDLWYIWYS